MRSILLLSLMIGFRAVCQQEVCIKEKWIAVTNDSTNVHLFEMKDGKGKEVSILKEIRNLVDAKKISLYCGNNGPCETSTKQYVNHLLSTPFWTNGYDSVHKYNPYFERASQSDVPLADSEGEPLIHTDEYGNQMYVYPPRTFGPYYLNRLPEIQVKEVNVKGVFVPKKIAFCREERGAIIELFWIDIDAVMQVATNEMLKKWLMDITNKNYAGFQFKQAECDGWGKR